jgi:DNA-binding LytR/AlgR family response regulator
MIALVFLQSISCQSSLVDVLKRLGRFTRIFEAESTGHCLALAEKHPNSIGFYSVAQSSRNLASRYWIAVGEKEQEALLAFQHNASGFISFPFDEAQIEHAVSRVQDKYHYFERGFQFNLMVEGLCKQYGVTESALLATLRRQLSQHHQPNVVGVRSENGWSCLNPAEIKWIEAAGDYMCVQTLSENIIVRTTLCDLLKRLGEHNFKRCNRSVAVNERHVAHLEQKLNQQRVVMQGGEAFKITHKYFYQFWQTR